MKNQLLYSLLAYLLLLTSCSLNEIPKATATSSDIFNSENGMKTYTYSFYDALPSGTNAYSQDAMSDYGAVNSINNFLKDGGYSAQTSSGWSWSQLRNINHFLDHCKTSTLPASVKENYIGVAKFFRAYFYLDKLIAFGDVPWVDHEVGMNEDSVLYGKRNSRTVIIDHIINDLDSAYNDITETSTDGTLITKWTALGLKTRAALYEASFRKYHTELNLQSTANKYYQEVVDAATLLMQNGPYSLYTGNGTSYSQRELFISDNPVTAETMLAVKLDKNLSVLGDANWWWTSSTYGPRFSLVRPFINVILNRDGTPYTDRVDYNTEDFYTECQNRDYRLSELIRTPGYTRDGKMAPPNFASYTYTGYQPIKYTLDPTSYDNGSLNTNSIPLMRYAEILLNFAEAKAELGTLTDQDWAQTIGALRARSGITDGLTSKPTKTDHYLQSTFYPGISDPVLLEIRRERMVELCLEGFRFDDLKRWKCGGLMASLQWEGIYVPGFDQLIDLDHDGTPDVVFYDGSQSKPSITVPSGCASVAVGGSSTNYLTLTADNHLEWSKAQPRTWYADGRQYYYPIPASAIVKNPALTQNPGW